MAKQPEWGAIRREKERKHFLEQLGKFEDELKRKIASLEDTYDEVDDELGDAETVRDEARASLDEATAVAGVHVAHAATARLDDRLIATGGRVLSVVAEGADFAEARGRAYDAMLRIRLEGGQYRRDIAERVAR